MDGDRLVVYLGSLLLIVSVVVINRWEKRSDFRDACRGRALERLQKPTGWQQLDAINARLYDAYRRLNSHE